MFIPLFYRGQRVLGIETNGLRYIPTWIRLKWLGWRLSRQIRKWPDIPYHKHDGTSAEWLGVESRKCGIEFKEPHGPK
jgi:hypothetical protein